jgi:aconitate decarboxylase
MSCAYVTAIQLIDRQVSPQEFHHGFLDRNDLWDLVDKTVFSQAGSGLKIRTSHDRIQGRKFDREDSGRTAGCYPGLSKEGILKKFRRFTKGTMDHQRRDAIERLVLEIER